MKQGILAFNHLIDRYGLLVSDLWEIDGLHCGQSLKVLIDNKWVQTRLEMTVDNQWYLVGTDKVGKDLEYLKAKIE